MDQSYVQYLSLLDALRTSLDQLSDLARQKTAAVRRDDLIALDEALKQEQAMSLALRGQEIKRTKLLKELGLDGSNLSRLVAGYPKELQFQAKQTVDALRQSYEVYRNTSDVARSTLEVNLRAIERLQAQQAGDTAQAEEERKSFQTDFRA